MGSLEERGFLEEGRPSGEDGDVEKALKGMNRTSVPELTEQQILEARERRAKQLKAEGLPTETTFREGEDFDVNEKDGAVTVPKDHPFASAAELTKEEQEKIRRALEPRRRGRAAAAARAGDEEDE